MYTHYSPVHSGSLTNHLPMYVSAMRAIGFETDKVHQLGQDYVTRLGLKDMTKAQDLTDLEGSYMGLLADYQHQLQEKGRDRTVRDFLEGRSGFMASGLFHGMIRLSFALKGEDDDEVARAISYFHAISETLDLPIDSPIADVPKEGWKTLMVKRMTLDLDSDRMPTMAKAASVLSQGSLRDHMTAIEIGPDTEKQLAYVFANWYMITRDFFVLHVITGYEALLSLKPYIGNYDEWLVTYWKMAQVMSLFTSERLPVIPIDIKPWEEIMEEAKAMTDPHDVKLFYACRELYNRYPLKVLKKTAHIVSHKYWGQASF